MGNTAREDNKTLITDLDKLKERLRTVWAKLDHVVISATVSLSVASSTDPDQLRVFCAPSFVVIPTLCNQLDSDLANLDATFLCGTNYGVFFLTTRW